VPSQPAKTASTTSRPGTASGRFTVQTGAYASLKKANTEARKYQAKGPSKAVQITDRSGKTLYAVQVGRYASKQDADRVRKTLGNGAIVAEVVD
jgi:septal ring-binding cell division protein DamX